LLCDCGTIGGTGQGTGTIYIYLKKSIKNTSAVIKKEKIMMKMTSNQSLFFKKLKPSSTFFLA
jgi:hypothetical protein